MTSNNTVANHFPPLSPEELDTAAARHRLHPFSTFAQLPGNGDVSRFWLFPAPVGIRLIGSDATVIAVSNSPSHMGTKISKFD